MDGAEGGIRTHTRSPSMVFETTAYTIPPLRLTFKYIDFDSPSQAKELIKDERLRTWFTSRQT